MRFLKISILGVLALTTAGVTLRGQSPPPLPERLDSYIKSYVTLTPDDRFVIDRRGDVVIGAGCMGHAFKMAPAIGEALADLAEGRGLGSDFERFRSDRPSLTGDVARSDRLAVEV